MLPGAWRLSTTHPVFVLSYQDNQEDNSSLEFYICLGIWQLRWIFNIMFTRLKFRIIGIYNLLVVRKAEMTDFIGGDRERRSIRGDKGRLINFSTRNFVGWYYLGIFKYSRWPCDIPIYWDPWLTVIKHIRERTYKPTTSKFISKRTFFPNDQRYCLSHPENSHPSLYFLGNWMTIWNVARKAWKQSERKKWVSLDE